MWSLYDFAANRLGLGLRYHWDKSPSISQSELASLIGASRQKVNAALGLLEDAGAIKRTRRRLCCDAAKLVRIASPD